MNYLNSLKIEQLRQPTGVQDQGNFPADVAQPKSAAEAFQTMVCFQEDTDKSVEARRRPWRSIQVHQVQDRYRPGRMLGEVIRILTVADEQGRTYYPTTFFAPAEALTGACTARGVISPRPSPRDS